MAQAEAEVKEAEAELNWKLKTFWMAQAAVDEAEAAGSETEDNDVKIVTFFDFHSEEYRNFLN